MNLKNVIQKPLVYIAGGILLFMTGLISGDIIPWPGPIKRCVKIVNVNEFPDIVIIACVFNRSGNNELKYVVTKDSCLKGNKCDRFYLLWTDTANFDSTGLADASYENFIEGLDKKSMNKNSPIHLLCDTIGLEAERVFKQGSFYENLSYKLYRCASGFSLYLSNRVSNLLGDTETTENFLPPPSVRKPKEKKTR